MKVHIKMSKWQSLIENSSKEEYFSPDSFVEITPLRL